MRVPDFLLSSVIFGEFLSGQGTKAAVEKAVFATKKTIRTVVNEYGISFECLLYG